MDSVTQIVLGAAVGNACLGKKIGNRALIWGGIAGTIPDLDVFFNGFFNSEIQALAFHRGPSHSVLFSVLFPFIMAFFVHKLYHSYMYKHKIYKWSIYILSSIAIGGFLLGIWQFVGEINHNKNYQLLGVFLVLLVSIYAILYKKYIRHDQSQINVSYSSWVWFFFWTIITHPVLDSFTSFGTLLYWPFSNARVAWDNISVADPFFTTPFLLSVIALAAFEKKSRIRMIVNWTGLGYAALYMLWTFSNLAEAKTVFQDHFKKNNISYSKLKVSPSILNNFLWFGVAETDRGYVRGWWSILDDEKKTDQMFFTPKNHELLAPYEGQLDVQTLKWFSDGFYQIIPTPSSDTLLYYDLRYGFSDGSNNYEPQSVFGFNLIDHDGRAKFSEMQRGAPIDDFSKIFKNYVKRIKGIKK